MSFELLEDLTFYKLVLTTTTSGEWEGGVYYPSTESIATYQPFYGDWEPMSRGEMTRVLPQGLMGSHAIQVMTDEPLKVSNDLGGTNFKEGDVIYLQDPESSPDTPAYDVFDMEDWHKNGGFELLDGHSTYICIRREKQ